MTYKENKGEIDLEVGGQTIGTYTIEVDYSELVEQIEEVCDYLNRAKRALEELGKGGADCPIVLGDMVDDDAAE